MCPSIEKKISISIPSKLVSFTKQIYDFRFRLRKKKKEEKIQFTVMAGDDSITKLTYIENF